MAHETLKTLITNNIKTNGQNAITAQILQDVLIAMVDDYPDLSGYATRTWVQQQDYAPKEWVQQQGYAKESALSDYLPLSGGTLTGALNIDKGASSIILDFGGIELIQSGSDFKIYADHNFITNKDSLIITNLVANTIGTIEIRHNKLSVDNSITATSFIKSGGTSSEFLKADGSVDSNTYLTSASLSGYATQSWVTTQLGDYLPLTGGTLTGALNIDKGASSIILDFGGIELMQSGSDFKIYADHNFITNKDSLIITNLVENTIGTIEIRHNKLSVDNSITATSFIKSGGTSAQFLKADGSVDSNAYITASALTGYATQSWVDTQLDSYLPLTGGILRGYLFFADENEQVVRGEIFGDEFGLNIQVAGYGKLFIENAIEADNTIKTEGFIKRGGTADQVLCADGSVKTLSALKAALDAL